MYWGIMGKLKGPFVLFGGNRGSQFSGNAAELLYLTVVSTRTIVSTSARGYQRTVNVFVEFCLCCLKKNLIVYLLTN
jgi:hypothetical protein